MKVLNFGSLNIDYVYEVDHFVQKGETLSSEALHVFTGGKGLNQSVALAKAGCEVYHAGTIGEDGKVLLKVLADAGVNTRHVLVRSDVSTGSAVIQKDSSGDNCIILYGGANQSITREYVDQVLAGFTAGDYIILQNEINEIPYIMKKAHEKGLVIVLNPSPLNEKVLACPLEYVDIFILNEIEAVGMLGMAAEEDAALLAALHEKYRNARIVLTLGRKGSRYIDRKQMLAQPIYQVETVDTTAAGDTFTGYFVAAMIQRKTEAEALDIAAKAASIAVSRMGAAPSIPSMDEVEFDNVNN